MAKGHSKGSSFEREICKQLSLWWTYGKSNDVFWRTAGSGAMAKTRSKTGGKAFGQHGDVQATNPIGQKLIDVCSIELKRGYSKNTFTDVLDKSDNAAEQTFESFIYQAEEDSINARAYSWLLITKRNRRQALIFMPFVLRKELIKTGSSIRKGHPIFSFSMITQQKKVYKIFGMTLDKFLETVQPKHIKKLHKKAIKEYSSVTYGKTRTGEINRDKEDQVFKCTSCDEHSVIWIGRDWQCQDCGAINDYPK